MNITGDCIYSHWLYVQQTAYGCIQLGCSIPDDVNKGNRLFGIHDKWHTNFFDWLIRRPIRLKPIN